MFVGRFGTFVYSTFCPAGFRPIVGEYRRSTGPGSGVAPLEPLWYRGVCSPVVAHMPAGGAVGDMD